MPYTAIRIEENERILTNAREGGWMPADGEKSQIAGNIWLRLQIAGDIARMERGDRNPLNERFVSLNSNSLTNRSIPPLLLP
jgi:hypothetical protein